jgi:hypothetical protein
VKILFFGRHYTYFRNFELVLQELARHGHAIHLAVERDESLGGLKLVQALAAAYPNVTYGEAPARVDDEWAWTAGLLRLGVDYLRYQHPLFDDALKLRERARERTPGAFVALGDFVHATGARSRHVVSNLLRRIERAVPEDPSIRAFVQAHRPDLVLLTPLISLGSSQIDYLRAARALQIPTALCVWSWDHLSSKALIREWPDRVFVWNETQRREAVELHELPGDRVIVTGAQCFDQWFDREPSRSRDEFCRQVGLSPERPFLLYVCSALFGGTIVEAQFVLDWIQRIRSSASPRLRDAGILVRPHPSRLFEWDGIEIGGLGAVLWGTNPVDAQAKADYFDSLHHSAAVVGINTSAFIEAGIAGRPVHTVMLPELAENQTGTLHFDYLLKAGGGLLNVAHDFNEHLGQLDLALANPATGVKPFVREFVRPHGLDRAATPIFVSEVEAMAGLAVDPVQSDGLAPAWRWIVRRIAATRDRPRFERWVLSARELESVIRMRRSNQEKAIRRAEVRAVKDAERLKVLHARQARLEEEHRRREASLEVKRQQRAEKEMRRATRRRRQVERGRGDIAARSRLKDLIKQKLG